MRSSARCRSDGTSSGAGYDAPHPRHDSSGVSVPSQAGNASSSRKSPVTSEDRVDERSKRLHRRRNDEQQAGGAKEDCERNEPASIGIASPQTARKRPYRSGGAAQNNHAALHSVSSLQHDTSSFRFVRSASRLVTRARSAISTSIPQR